MYSVQSIIRPLLLLQIALLVSCESAPTSLQLDEKVIVVATDTIKPCVTLTKPAPVNVVLTTQAQLDSIVDFIHDNPACLDWAFPENVLNLGTVVCFSTITTDRVERVSYLMEHDTVNNEYTAITKVYLRNPADPIEPKNRFFARIFIYPEFEDNYGIEFVVDTVAYAGS